MNYTEVNFKITPYSEDIADVLISELGEIGFDGFAGTPEGFQGYIPAKDYNPGKISNLEGLTLFAEQFGISWTTQEIEDQNWNKVWEDNFTPIVVDNRILVRAGFHDTIPGIPYEIIIEPRMSFGTGHHDTTALMLRMIDRNASRIKGQRVLDMGCGTGILSVMAIKAGAAGVTGIDIDEWAYNNAMENMRNNGISGDVTMRIGDAALLRDEADFGIILANINRNILLNDMHRYNERLSQGGLLFMSGYYLHDLPMIREEAERLGLSFVEYQENNGWTAATFYKN